ncbi:MAG: hypothetical protein KGZ39_00765 [Simkania sp.]|nr:hypothetical protein [Simkania sp.]
MAIHKEARLYQNVVETTTHHPSYFISALSEKIAQFLVIARKKTTQEGGVLLPVLSSIRNDLISYHGGKEITLQTRDHALINGMHFAGSLNKGIIFLHGNGNFYETSIARPLSWIQDLGQTSADGKIFHPHLLVFNPRGTGKSEGITHPDNVAEDLLAAFMYLVYEHSVDPNHIVIAGHSMGAFFSALGADLIQQTFPDNKINLLSDRSFSGINSRVDLRIKQAKHSKIVHSIFCSTLHRLTAWSHWNKNPLGALERLKGRVCVVYHKNDAVIPYDTSLHQALLRTHRTRSYSCLSLKETENVSELSSRAHNREFSDEEHTKVIDEMKKMLQLPLSIEEDSFSLDTLTRDPF